jgi:hypothetical protein
MMTSFEKFCAVPAFIFGIIFLILGVFGLFLGCKFSITLPPVLGVLPAIIGWGILRSIAVAWRRNSEPPDLNSGLMSPANDR